MRKRDDPVAFETNGERLDVHDTVMDVTCTLTASGPLEPVRVSTDRFLFPVDGAVAFETDTLTLPTNTAVYVRNEEGDVVASVPGDEAPLPAGTYYIETTPGCKLYVKVFGAAFTFTDGPTDSPAPTTVEFDGRAHVAVGARSLHKRPAATITVPDDPGALREALPYLASGVKEWSCERSWSTLRGHPPRIERGDALDIPAHLSKPETGVTLAVPETYEALYTVTPLAYYLGADVVPGDTPELRLDNGFTDTLTAPGESLADAVRSLLRRCLFLDSLVRVGGYYSFERQEYEAVAGELPFYPPELYDSAISEQLMEYLEVDDAVLDDYLPPYRYDAVLRADPGDAPLLPHLLDDFVPVCVAGDAAAAGDDAFYTGYSSDPIPDGATKLSVAGFEHALDAPPRALGDERVALLGVGRTAMDGITAAFTDHGDGSSYERVRIDRERERPTITAVRDAIAEEYGFVHVGAPVTQAGIECADGVLDPATLTDVGARVVSLVGPLDEAGPVLDALVERGATRGVASAALSGRALGQVVGHVLSGSPFAQSLVWSDYEDPYRFAGDIAACPVVRNGASAILEHLIRSESADTHRLRMRAWWRLDGDNGTSIGMSLNYIVHPHCLVGATVEAPVALTSEEVADLIAERDGVYVLNGEVCQHDEEMTAADVRRSAQRALKDPDPVDTDR